MAELNNYELEEGYGDPHLHYNSHPNDIINTNSCKWSPQGKAPYEQYVSETPMYPQQCHVEYCHPGSWQGKGGAAEAPQIQMQMEASAPQMAEETGILASLISFLKNNMLYAGIGVALAFFVYYFILKRKVQLFK
jgi:hypothetical protein